MVLEIALIDVTDPEGFRRAYLEARAILRETPGVHSVRMTQGVETPNRHVLMVEWESVAAHEENFRATDRYTRWRELIGPHFSAPPRVEHFVDID